MKGRLLFHGEGLWITFIPSVVTSRLNIEEFIYMFIYCMCICSPCTDQLTQCNGECNDFIFCLNDDSWLKKHSFRWRGNSFAAFIVKYFIAEDLHGDQKSHFALVLSFSLLIPDSFAHIKTYNILRRTRIYSCRCSSESISSCLSCQSFLGKTQNRCPSLKVKKTAALEHLPNWPLNLNSRAQSMCPVWQLSPSACWFS